MHLNYSVKFLASTSRRGLVVSSSSRLSHPTPDRSIIGKRTPCNSWFRRFVLYSVLQVRNLQKHADRLQNNRSNQPITSVRILVPTYRPDELCNPSSLFMVSMWVSLRTADLMRGLVNFWLCFAYGVKVWVSMTRVWLIWGVKRHAGCCIWWWWSELR